MIRNYQKTSSDSGVDLSPIYNSLQTINALLYRLDVQTTSGGKCEFSINITFVFFPDQANYPRKQWKSYENFLGKRLKVQGIYYFFNYTSGDYSVDYYNVLPTVRNDITLLDPIA